MSVVVPNDRGDGLSVVSPATNTALPVPMPPPNSLPGGTVVPSSGVFLSAPAPVPVPLPVHTPPMKMADPSIEKQHPPIPNSTDYLAQLLNDKKSLSVLPNMFMHVERIIDEEISKVRKNMYNINNDNTPLVLPEPQGAPITLSEKLYVPVKTYPDFNFVGRILGPRGMYAKQLEKETGCKIMIRGKGSMRDKKKVGQEEQNKDKHNWEHLSEDLHVLVTVEDTPNRAQLKMDRAKAAIKKLLVPTADGEDELKKRQLMELAIINGTFRDTSSKNSSNPSTPLGRWFKPRSGTGLSKFIPRHQCCRRDHRKTSRPDTKTIRIISHKYWRRATKECFHCSSVE